MKKRKRIDTATFAKAILDAQSIREESWNGKHYEKSYEQTAKESLILHESDVAFASIISMLNLIGWNDAQAWAEENKD